MPSDCDLIRCGGYDPGYQWRAALQLCLDTYGGGISGVNLNNLNITNSISDGLSIIGGNGTLSGAVAANVSIPNYGIGASARNGIWARYDAVGSLIISNSAIAGYKDDSSSFAFLVPVSVQASPAGCFFTVDGTAYSSAQAFNWVYGSSHTMMVASPQSGGTGIQYVWSSWSDGNAMTQTNTITANTNYTANFSTQYYLTMNAGVGGGVSPGSGWNSGGAVVNISATASNSYNFVSWIGNGIGSYSGSNNLASVTMNGPITQTASFTGPPVQALAFVQQPGNVLQGATLVPEVRVQAFDMNGQALANATITMSLGSGAGTLAGTVTRFTDAAGIAHFNDLSLNQAGPKMFTASALTGSAPSTNSNSFMVIGPALALAFTTQPGSAVVGVPFWPATGSQNSGCLW